MRRWRQRTHTNGLHHRPAVRRRPGRRRHPGRRHRPRSRWHRSSRATEPVARSRRLTRLRDDAPLLPPGAAPVRTATSGHLRAHLARGEGWTLRARHWDDGTGDVMVTAIDDALADSVLAAATGGAQLPASDDGTVDVRFWYQDRGPTWSERAVAVEPWSDIRRNYERGAAEALDSLMGTGPGRLDGRVLLLHGPPGTGKTTALRALAQAWRSWCRLEVVVDPERLLGSAAVPHALPPRWRRRRRVDLAARRARGLRRAHPGRGEGGHRPGLVAPAEPHRRVHRPGPVAPPRDHDQRADPPPPPGGRPTRSLPRPRSRSGRCRADEALRWLGHSGHDGQRSDPMVPPWPSCTPGRASSASSRCGPADVATGQYL